MLTCHAELLTGSGHMRVYHNFNCIIMLKPVIPVDNFGTVVGENPTPYGIVGCQWTVYCLLGYQKEYS